MRTIKKMRTTLRGWCSYWFMIVAAWFSAQWALKLTAVRNKEAAVYGMQVIDQLYRHGCRLKGLRELRKDLVLQRESAAQVLDGAENAPTTLSLLKIADVELQIAAILNNVRHFQPLPVQKPAVVQPLTTVYLVDFTKGKEPIEILLCVNFDDDSRRQVS